MSLNISKSRLVGQVQISGAKNSALRLLVASLLTRDTIRLKNYPAGLRDAEIQCEMLSALGKICISDKDSISISEPEKLETTLEWEDRSIRNTLLMLGALLTRHGYAKVPIPGGCQLGDRKYDIHKMVIESFGGHVADHGDGWLTAESDGRLKGTEIVLPIRSTGATENAILCATLAIGKTRIWNPHIRPEIIDLVNMLKKMGAEIVVRGQESIIVTGKESLSGTEHTVIQDNVEALTWLIGAIITNGEIEIEGFPYDDLEVPLIFLRESGAKYYRHEDRMIVKGGTCYPVELSTGPYPGINSDMQPIFAVYGAVANGESRIIDLRFPGRYAYANELAKMGMMFTIDKNLLQIYGGKKLSGAIVKSLDLRAGAALMLAACVADGTTTIEDSWQIERGYNNLVEKLKNLSVNISSD